MGDIQEHLNDLLLLEEGKLQDMIIIGDQHLLEFQDNLHNMLIMVHNMGEVIQTMTIILMISWLCNKIHTFSNMWKHIWSKTNMHVFNI